MSIPTYSTSDQFARSFPPPEYLTTPAVGINISDYSIKHMFLKREKDTVVLESFGKVGLPLDTIERGEIKDPETLTKQLVNIREEHGYSHAHLALPEEHAYLFQIELPKKALENLGNEIAVRLTENVPLGADEATFDYNILRVGAQTVELNVSVYPMAIAAHYSSIIEDAGYALLSMEVEGQATARSLLPPDDAVPTLIIDIGRNEASLSISTGGVVIVTASIETGGDSFTRAIAQAMDLSFQEAEKLRRKYGFVKTKEGKAVYEAQESVVKSVRDTIQKHLLYWQMHANTVGPGVRAVERVVLVGGNSNMKGLAPYLAGGLDLPVEIGNVWCNLFDFDVYIPRMPAWQSLEFATSVGLALRSISRSG